MCRNNYNNKLKAVDVNFVRNINNILKKNRRVLVEICPEEKHKTTRATLQKKGFDFSYFTHQRKTQAGAVYFFVYDYGYLGLDNDFFLVVKDNKSKE